MTDLAPRGRSRWRVAGVLLAAAVVPTLPGRPAADPPDYAAMTCDQLISARPVDPGGGWVALPCRPDPHSPARWSCGLAPGDGVPYATLVSEWRAAWLAMDCGTHVEALAARAQRRAKAERFKAENPEACGVFRDTYELADSKDSDWGRSFFGDLLRESCDEAP